MLLINENYISAVVPRDVVIELLVLRDVEATVGQEGGHGQDDLGPFGARQRKDELRRPRPCPCCRSAGEATYKN